MSAADRAALDRLREDAPGGIWQVEERDGRVVVTSDWLGFPTPVCSTGGATDPVAWTVARLIAAARQELPAVLAELAAAKRERDQALDALARIERGEGPTASEMSAVRKHGGLSVGRMTLVQIVAAAARLNIGEEMHG